MYWRFFLFDRLLSFACVHMLMFYEFFALILRISPIHNGAAPDFREYFLLLYINLSSNICFFSYVICKWSPYSMVQSFKQPFKICCSSSVKWFEMIKNQKQNGGLVRCRSLYPIIFTIAIETDNWWVSIDYIQTLINILNQYIPNQNDFNRKKNRLHVNKAFRNFLSFRHYE